MKLGLIACAALIVPMAAWADNPHDPAMQKAEARERDRAMVRELNRRELDHVQRRDTAEAALGTANATALADYARQRARYERDLAAWRQARAGY
jgi:hypothetical protein